MTSRGNLVQEGPMMYANGSAEVREEGSCAWEKALEEAL